jgi:hypothetical protein
MMDIRIFIGMPLWYAKSVLEEKGIPFTVEETKSRSHFFKCNEQSVYVIRTTYTNEQIQLLVNYSLEASQDVCNILRDRNGDYEEPIF